MICSLAKKLEGVEIGMASHMALAGSEKDNSFRMNSSGYAEQRPEGSSRGFPASRRDPLIFIQILSVMGDTWNEMAWNEMLLL